jgi:hypothetical protein
VNLESFGVTRYYALDFAPPGNKAVPAAVDGGRVAR